MTIQNRQIFISRCKHDQSQVCKLLNVCRTRVEVFKKSLRENSTPSKWNHRVASLKCTAASSFIIKYECYHKTTVDISKIFINNCKYQAEVRHLLSCSEFCCQMEPVYRAYGTTGLWATLVCGFAGKSASHREAQNYNKYRGETEC